MRRQVRRLLLIGVALVITGLVFYIAAQWMVKNPLSFRAVELVPPDSEGELHTLHFEIRNESMFPVVVHGLMWADMYADGSMGRRGPLFSYPWDKKETSFTLAAGETRRETFSETNASELSPGESPSRKELWLRYIWEPPIQERMSPLMMWIHERYMGLQDAWKGRATPLDSLTQRRMDVAGPAVIPEPSTSAKR